jgi:uncharacterized protein Yka (UPF0111/DUF47 family)
MGALGSTALTKKAVHVDTKIDNMRDVATLLVALYANLPTEMRDKDKHIIEAVAKSMTLCLSAYELLQTPR